VAVRDVEMALAAYALARLTESREAALSGAALRGSESVPEHGSPAAA
jgi:hypothetical protein